VASDPTIYHFRSTKQASANSGFSSTEAADERCALVLFVIVVVVV
jgi:hypothetical protein